MSKAQIHLPEGLFDTEPPTSSRLLAWAGAKQDPSTGKMKPREKTRRKTIAASTFTRTLAETEEMMASREWGDASIRHLVALYDRMHLKVYGVEVMTTASERHTMTLRAGAFVKKQFGGNIVAAVEYFRWVWMREMGNEKRNRELGREGARRIGFWLMLSGSMLTDYRVALTRKR